MLYLRNYTSQNSRKLPALWAGGTCKLTSRLTFERGSWVTEHEEAHVGMAVSLPSETIIHFGVSKLMVKWEEVTWRIQRAFWKAIKHIKLQLLEIKKGLERLKIKSALSSPSSLLLPLPSSSPSYLSSLLHPYPLFSCLFFPFILLTEHAQLGPPLRRWTLTFLIADPLCLTGSVLSLVTAQAAKLHEEPSFCIWMCSRKFFS